jgi:CubicO group peptidase (beta-lactamase class C family)
MTSDTAPRGTVAPGFEDVAEVFEQNYKLGLERGSAFAAALDGCPVVDLWGGHARESVPWESDSLQVIFSGSKALAALCVLVLLDRGLLTLDTRVAHLWPEFASGGKADVTVFDVLTHQAGIPGFTTERVTLTELTDPERVRALLLAEPVWWPGVRRVAYHSLTFGWLCAELVRRATGISLSDWFRSEVAAPLDLDIWISLPEEHEHRVTELVRDPSFTGLISTPAERGAYNNPGWFEEPLRWNEPAFHRAEFPAAGALATARSMARLYGCLACDGTLDGVRILSAETVKLARTRHVDTLDALYQQPISHGLGFQIETGRSRYGGVQDGFGHDGAGGSLHGVWPTERVSFSYAMNLMRPLETDVRGRRLLDALRAAVRQVTQ